MKLRSCLIVIAGILVGISLCAAGGWLLIHHYVRERAESPETRPLDASKQLLRATAALNAASDEYHRWIALSDYAFWSVDAGIEDAARISAEEVLKLSAKYRNDWNYGNAIHKGNLTLGRLALRAGDKQRAREYLRAAGNTPGSPQLNAFGPNMVLAKELLAEGEVPEVLDYFDQCGAFWKMDFGALDAWRDIVKEGRVPNFGANLLY